MIDPSASAMGGSGWARERPRAATSLLAGASALLLMVIAMGVWLSFSRAESEMSRVRADLVGDAERHAVLLDQRLMAQLRVLNVLAEAPVIRAADGEGIEAYFRRLGDQPVGFEGGVAFIGADPPSEVRSEGASPDPAAVQGAAAATLAGQRRHIGGYGLDAVTGVPHLAMAVRVEVDEVAVGAIVGLKDPLSLDPDALTSPTGRRHLVDASGRTVAARDGRLEVVRPRLAALREALDAVAASGLDDDADMVGAEVDGQGIGGEPRILAGARLTSCECLAVVEGDPRVLLDPISRRRALEVGLQLLLALSGTLLIVRLIRHLRVASAGQALARDTAEALQEALSVIAAASRVDGVHGAIADHVLPALGAVEGGLLTLGPDDDDEPRTSPVLGALRPVVAAVLGTEPLTLSLEQLRRRAPSVADAVAAVDGHVVVAAPVVTHATASDPRPGALVVVLPRNAPLQQLALDRLPVLSAQVARAISRVTRSEFERDVARTLRASLLDHSLPDVPGIQIATRYVPATEELDVGGDWFQSVEAEDGSIMVVLGDVVGHGLQAAAAMGQVRSAAKALARYHGPADLLQRLDDFVAATPACYMCSAVAVRIDLSDDTLTYAVAGHPPPVLRQADGHLLLLDDVTGTPLGVTSQAREARVLGFDAGAAILLFTDGLVERRGLTVDVGLGRVRDAMTEAAPPDDGAAWLDGILSRVGTEEADDDIALILVRRLPVISIDGSGQTVPGSVLPILPTSRPRA